MRSAPAGTYLDEILAHKVVEIEQHFAGVELQTLQKRASRRSGGKSLYAALKQPGLQVIAEIKRRSPSKGELRADLDPVAIAAAYVEGGAAAISILTDERFFGGSLEDLARVRQSFSHGQAPVLLRKDFIVDERQVTESAAAGADAILLIVAALSRGQLIDLLALTHEVGLEALVEVHDESELETAIEVGARIIGVNNRDLRSFNTDIAVSERLLPVLPTTVARVAESGLSSKDDLRRVAEAGADAVLMGEVLMKSRDIQASLRELLS